MIDMTDRRCLLALALGALPTSSMAALSLPATAEVPVAARDFNFFLGTWRVEHRRLKKRLAGNDDWEVFAGRTVCWPLMGGLANINDSVSWRGGKEARGIGLRAFDGAAGTWADWTLGTGAPGHMEPPGVGRFTGRTGTFLSDDVFEGRPIVVRGIFRDIDADTAQWEQAFSADGGQTWETNWVMRYLREPG